MNANPAARRLPTIRPRGVNMGEICARPSGGSLNSEDDGRAVKAEKARVTMCISSVTFNIIFIPRDIKHVIRNIS